MFNHTLHACWNFSHHLVWLLLLDAECHIAIAQPSSDHQGAVKHGDNYGDPPECWRDCQHISLRKSTFKQIQFCCKFYLNMNVFVNSYLNDSIRICHLLDHDKLAVIFLSWLCHFGRFLWVNILRKDLTSPSLHRQFRSFKRSCHTSVKKSQTEMNSLKCPTTICTLLTLRTVCLFEKVREINSVSFTNCISSWDVFVVGRCCMMWYNIFVMWACGVVVQQ